MQSAPPLAGLLFVICYSREATSLIEDETYALLWYETEQIHRILVRVLRLMSTLILQFEYDQCLERARQALGDPGMARVAPGGPGSKVLGAPLKV